jgi:hypothetical protein
MYVAWNGRQDIFSMPHIGLARINADGSSSEPVDATGKISIPARDAKASGDNVYVVVSNSTKNIGGLPDGVDVYFTASAVKGDSFGKTITLSDDNAIKTLLAAQQKSLSFVNPMLAVSGSHIYVAWGAAYPDSHELFLRASSDGGRTFGKITSLNEEVDEPVSRGLAVLTSSSAMYAIIIVGAVAAAVFGFLYTKHRRGTH